MSEFNPPPTRQTIKGDQRAYGKKHERKRIGREARKAMRHYLRRWLP